MKLEVRKARAAAVAANLAAQAAVAARELLAEDPSAWEVGDAAYWLCRAAQKACENAADALDPEEAGDQRRSFSPRTSSPAAPRRKPATRRTNWSPWPKKRITKSAAETRGGQFLEGGISP